MTRDTCTCQDQIEYLEATTTCYKVCQNLQMKRKITLNTISTMRWKELIGNLWILKKRGVMWKTEIMQPSALLISSRTQLAAQWALQKVTMNSTGNLGVLLCPSNINIMSRFRCNTAIQFEQYDTFIKKLFIANDNEIFELTGCLSNCHKYKYNLKALGPISKHKVENPTSALKLLFYYPATEHSVYNQVCNLKYILFMNYK